MARQDPKYDFSDGQVWHRTGHYWIPEDEPLMVFRGKDTFTLFAIEGYLNGLKQALHEMTPSERAAGLETIVKDHIRSANERYETILEWQQTHPDRIGTGCHLDGCRRFGTTPVDVSRRAKRT